MRKQQQKSGNTYFIPFMVLLLITLKLCGAAYIPWGAITAPFAIAAGFALCAMLFFLGYSTVKKLFRI